MTSFLWLLRLSACVLFFGCSTATTLQMRDGTVARGHLTRTSDTTVRVDLERGHMEVPLADVVDVTHADAGRIATGSTLFLLGTIGQVALSVLIGTDEPGIDPDTGFRYDDDGCEFCVLGFAATMPPLTFGSGLLFHGLALSLESRNVLSEDPSRVGSAHLRLGGGVLGTGLLFGALMPMIFSDNNARAGVGFAVTAFAPGLVLSGIALLIRGGRLRHGQRPAVELTGNGFAFDLSL